MTSKKKKGNLRSQFVFKNNILLKSKRSAPVKDKDKESKKKKVNSVSCFTKSKKTILSKSKTSQQSIGMSFGTIFSIILIIFFVVIAFIVIKYFLGLQKCTQIGIFLDDIQNEIDTAWNSEKSEFAFNPSLPSNLEYVCFANLSKSLDYEGILGEISMDIGLYEGTGANLFLYPTINACDIPYHTVNHIDLDEMIGAQNPYCIEISEGKALLNIKKDRGERLVRIS